MRWGRFHKIKYEIQSLLRQVSFRYDFNIKGNLEKIWGENRSMPQTPLKTPCLNLQPKISLKFSQFNHPSKLAYIKIFAIFSSPTIKEKLIFHPRKIFKKFCGRRSTEMWYYNFCLISKALLHKGIRIAETRFFPSIFFSKEFLDAEQIFSLFAEQIVKWNKICFSG